MEVNFKRKLDCILDNMDVIVPDDGHLDYFDQKGTNKKLKVSVNARVEPLNFQEDGYPESDIYRTSYSCDGSMQIEDETKHPIMLNRVNLGDDDMEDIPSTTEVLDSLRKVMLWMSAQEDNNSDHIEYLSHVERYALSKCDCFAQQRKITEFFVKHD